MSQKIYVDSRSRVSGSNEDFEFALPYSITIPEESAMVVDQVVIPNSFYSIEEDLNDQIYVFEANFSNSRWRRATVAPGYYDAVTLAPAIKAAMDNGRLLFSAYSCTYDSIKGRYIIGNPFTTEEEICTIWTREALKEQVPGFGWADFDPSDLKDACRQIGMVTGDVVSSGTFSGRAPLVMNHAPVLQLHINLFLKSNSIGMPATNVGPNNSMTILRRVVMDAPQLSLNVDSFSTMWDQVRLAPQSISSFRITLCGFDGRVVNLQEQPWSFSMTIFPRE